MKVIGRYILAAILLLAAISNTVTLVSFAIGKHIDTPIVLLWGACSVLLGLILATDLLIENQKEKYEELNK
jgi:hypothetical protein